MEVPDLLSNAAKRFPDRPAVVEGDRSITFAEASDRAGRLAGSFRQVGLGKGDRVALLALNELEYTEIQVAASRAGAILVPMNYRLAVPELAYMIADSAPRVLIHGPGYAGVAHELGVERSWHLGEDGAGEPYDQVLAGGEASAAPSVIQAADPACILYTSGTTGSPKGAIISNGALWARVNSFGLEIGMAPGEVFVQTLPMFHIAAITGYAFTYRGATNVMVKAFDPAGVVATLERHRATHILMVPTTINALCNDPAVATAGLGSLRLVLYGGSPISPEVLRRAMAALHCEFLQFFGMTETSGCSLLRPADHDPDHHPERLASAGTDALSFEVRVVDPEDRILPTGVVGEIVCRGPCLMDGYWGSSGATVEALRGGWMHTGDLGYRSEDGYLYVTDRLKDMIVSGGENVYPREVEDVLYEHPAVMEVAVIGIPDRRWGEVVHAVVVPRPGRVPDRDELRSHCGARLAAYKVPKSFEVVDAVPKNAMGKIMKKDLREQYWEGVERRIH